MERELPAAVKCKKYPPHLSVPFQAEAWRVCYFNYTRSTLNCSYFQVSLPTMCSWLRQAQPPDPGLPNGFDRARSLPTGHSASKRPVIYQAAKKLACWLRVPSCPLPYDVTRVMSARGIHSQSALWAG